MPKNCYDQYDTKCTRCRQEVYSGGGNQFIDDNGVLQRYCHKCHKKWWQELERKYDAAAAKSAESTAVPTVETSGPAAVPPEPAPPHEVDRQLPPPPSDVLPTQGDGAHGSPQGPILGS